MTGIEIVESPITPDLIRKVEAIYARVPRMRNCNRRCRASCGPIDMFRVEFRRIAEALGFEPPAHTPSGDCPMLDATGSCKVYEIRPLICRLWGAVDTPGMRCAFGCEPERWLSKAEADGLLREMAKLSRPMFRNAEAILGLTGRA